MANFLTTLIVTVALLAISHLPIGVSISVDAVEEGTCSGENYPLADFMNQTWVGTIPVFYLVGGSSYHMSRAVKHAFGNYARQLRYLSENEVSNTACFTVRFTGEGLNVKSFNGANINYKSTSVSDGVSEIIPMSYPIGELCRTTATLTDNKSFAVLATCWPDQDQKGWVVLSTSRTFTPEGRQQVEDHPEP